MQTVISITTHAHNECEASELKSFLIDGMGFEQLPGGVFPGSFAIETKTLVSLLKNDEVKTIYNQLIMHYLTGYMPSFKLVQVKRG